MRIRSLIVCAVGIVTFGLAHAEADPVPVELEYRTDTLAWTLFAQVVDAPMGNNGDHGIAAVRALIDNINFGTNGEAVILSSGIGAINPVAVGTPNERPAVLMTSGGTIDIIYGQNTANAPSVVGGVGVGSRALIMQGTFASAAFPPAFGNDDNGFVTDGNFLNAAAPGPFGLALPWTGVTLSVIDITPGGGLGGDYNGDGTVDAADYTVWRNNLGGNASAFAAGTRDPMNSGEINNGDYNFWKNAYGASGSAAATSANTLPVPEPSSLSLISLAAALLVRLRFDVRPALRSQMRNQ